MRVATGIQLSGRCSVSPLLLCLQAAPTPLQADPPPRLPPPPSQVPLYCVNEFVLSALLDVSDVGGSIVIHTFGETTRIHCNICL